MPSRNDVYDGLRRIFLAAGAVTVMRGYYFPEDETLDGKLYPLVALHEEDEQIEAGNFPFFCKGVFNAWMYVETGVYGNDVMSGGAEAYKKLDEMHDAILSEFEDYFPTYFAQTIMVAPTQFSIWYWYRAKDLPVVAASMRIRFDLNGPLPRQ